MPLTFTETGQQGQVTVDSFGGAGHEIRSNGGLHILGGHLIGGGPTATATANANASVTQITGNDVAGQVWYTTNATPSQGPQVIVTFASPFFTSPNVLLTPTAPSLTSVYVAASTNSFLVNSAVTPVVSGSLSFYYGIIG